MLFRSAGLFSLIAAATFASCQAPATANEPPSDLRIVFDNIKPKTFWIADSVPTNDSDKVTTTKASSVIIPTKGLGLKSLLLVHELTTGNLAYKKIGDIHSEWKVVPSDFTLLYRVRVRVLHDGDAVATGTIRLSSGGKSQTQILEANDLGEVSFFSVPMGQVKLEVTYKSEGKTKRLPAQTILLDRTREAIEPTLSAVIDDPVELAPMPRLRKMHFTVNPGQKLVNAESQSTSPVGKFVVFAGSTVLGLAVLYGLLKLIQRHPDQVRDKLGKLGVKLPDAEPEVGQDVASAVAPKTPQPIEKIILEPDLAPTSAIVQTVAQLANPRLTSEQGIATELLEGIHEVGREPGLALSLTDESTISRHHAQIIVSGASVVIKDLGSTNGTFVNGIRVEGESPLSAGDVVQFGAVRFRFEA